MQDEESQLRDLCMSIEEINNFYIKVLKKKAKFAVLGLNPHCESTNMFNEDEKILKPLIKSLAQKKYKKSLMKKCLNFHPWEQR